MKPPIAMPATTPAVSVPPSTVASVAMPGATESDVDGSGIDNVFSFVIVVIMSVTSRVLLVLELMLVPVLVLVLVLVVNIVVCCGGPRTVVREGLAELLATLSNVSVVDIVSTTEL